jgi:hypothetical protein
MGPRYQLKIGLRGSKPPIWRRLVIGGETTLDELHVAIQIAMGWQNAHLHEFTIDGVSYGRPDPMGFTEVEDESAVRLDQVAPDAGMKFAYLYDFGDSWEHLITVEKILPLDPRDPKQHYPACTAGRGACPPEDVGGLWGYYAWLEALADPDSEEHEEALEALGEEFDPKALDLEAINRCP